MNTKRIAAALAAAALVVLGSSTSAFADYGSPTITLTVTPTSLTGGQSFTGTASSDADCTAWTITFDGPTTEGAKTGSGNSIDFEYSTTEVEQVITGTVHAVCDYDNGSARAAAPARLTADADVVVNPVLVSPPTDGGGSGTGGGGFGGLADTGGPHLWLAIGGALLTLLGAGAVIRSRRISA